MNKKQLKKKLLDIRNGGFITPVLDELWREYQLLLDKIHVKEAREDYKDGRVYTHKEVFGDKNNHKSNKEE